MRSLELEITVAEREVLRNLGYPRGRRPAPRVERRLAEVLQSAPRLLRPRGVFRMVDQELAGGAGVPAREGTAAVALALCTIGPELEAAEQRHTSEDRMLDALLLDAYGSAAAEAAADAMNRRLCNEARARGCHLRPRFSPGYGGWDICHQAPLLALLDAPSVGVSLTDGMMMLPRKSVSFAARLVAGEPEPGAMSRRCQRCGMRDCLYRDEPSSPSD